MSIRARLVTLFCSVLVLALLAGGLATYFVMRNTLLSRIDAQLTAAARPIIAISNRVGLSDRCGFRVRSDLPPHSTGRVPRFEQPPFSSFYLAARSSDGRIRYACSAYLNSKPISPSLPGEQASLADLASSSQSIVTVSGRGAGQPAMRLLIAKVRSGLLYIALPLNDVEGTLHNLFIAESIVLGVTVVLASIAAALAIRSGLRPLRDIESVATRISEGAFDERIVIGHAPDEVQRVGSAMNTMLDEVTKGIGERDALVGRLRDRDERLRRFVADASHELRTPVAAVAAYVELFGRGAASHPDDLARVLDGIGRETDRMQNLVNDLLTLATLDEGLRSEVQEVDLLELVDDAVELARAVAPGWPITVVGDEPAVVLGNPQQLRRAVDNLLANVREHTPAGTSTGIRVQHDVETASIEVQDDGPGMDEVTSDHAFDRFFRGDAGRDRATGGAGLGLSIVEAIVHAHGGSVRLATPPGGGTSVTIAFKLVRTGTSEPTPISSPSHA